MNTTSKVTVLSNDLIHYLNDGLAVGILVYIASLPPETKITKAGIYSHFIQGRQAIDRSFKYLVNKGIIITEQLKDENGRFSEAKWTINLNINSDEQ